VTQQKRTPGTGRVDDRWLNKDGSPSVRYKKGDRWMVRFITPAGKETTESFPQGQKPQAFARLNELVTSVRSNTYIAAEAGRVTVAERADVYLASKAGRKPSSIVSIRSLLTSQILPRWGSVEVGKVEAEEVELWVAGMTERLSSSRTRQAFHLFQAILDTAVHRKLIPINPCRDEEVHDVVPKLRTERGHRFLSMDQVHALAAACGGARDIILTLALTGIRWGELVALRVSSVQPELMRVMVDASTSEVNGTLVDGSTKSGKARTVSVPPEVMALLLKRSKGKLPGARLFTTGNGATLRGRNFRRDVYDRAVESVPGMWERLTIHELRHTYASLAYHHGVPPLVISRNLGHADLSITFKIYVELFDSELDQSGSLLGAAYAAAKSTDESNSGLKADWLSLKT
jgi:integrase